MSATIEKIDLRRERSVNSRKQLIQATLSVIAQKGLAGTTLTTVSEESGLSRSSVGFHFKSKDQMLTEALQHLLQEYKEGWIQINEQNELSAAEKLTAMVEWELGHVACTRKKVAVWFAFWGEVTTRNIYKKLVSKSDEQYLQIIKSLIFQLNENESQAEIIAIGLSSMIIGLWMDFNIGVENFDRELARQTCMNYLQALFPEHF